MDLFPSLLSAVYSRLLEMRCATRRERHWDSIETGRRRATLAGGQKLSGASRMLVWVSTFQRTRPPAFPPPPVCSAFLGPSSSRPLRVLGAAGSVQGLKERSPCPAPVSRAVREASARCHRWAVLGGRRPKALRGSSVSAALSWIGRCRGVRLVSMCRSCSSTDASVAQHRPGRVAAHPRHDSVAHARCTGARAHRHESRTGLAAAHRS